MKAKSALSGLYLGLAESADLIGKSETHVLQLVKDGLLKRRQRGQYLARDVARAALRYRESEDRRASQTEEVKRYRAAKTRQLEFQISRERGELVSIEAVTAAHSEIIGTFCAELSGVPAASTRDLAQRAEIEGHLNAAIERCRARLSGAEGDLRAGRDPLVDAEDTDA